jgi:hypothetical protein
MGRGTLADAHLPLPADKTLTFLYFHSILGFPDKKIPAPLRHHPDNPEIILSFRGHGVKKERSRIQGKWYYRSDVQRRGGEDSEIEEVNDYARQPDKDRDAPDDGDYARLLLGLCDRDSGKNHG